MMNMADNQKNGKGYFKNVKGKTPGGTLETLGPKLRSNQVVLTVGSSTLYLFVTVY